MLCYPCHRTSSTNHTARYKRYFIVGCTRSMALSGMARQQLWEIGNRVYCDDLVFVSSKRVQLLSFSLCPYLLWWSIVIILLISIQDFIMHREKLELVDSKLP